MTVHAFWTRKKFCNIFDNSTQTFLQTKTLQLKILTLGGKVPQVNDNNLRSPITIKELGATLKKMKHNKTPTIDGITVKFMKVVWGHLKFFIKRANDKSFEKWELSSTFRSSLITCLPKGNKIKKK